jgi:hypothetical protein
MPRYISSHQFGTAVTIVILFLTLLSAWGLIRNNRRATLPVTAVVEAAQIAQAASGKTQLYEVRIYRIKPGMMGGSS